MEISERMGVLPRIEEYATGTTEMVVHRPWAARPARIDYLKLLGAFSDRHVEIMRDDLSEIYYDATRNDVEYMFGDQITAITDDGVVSFRDGVSRRFDLVVGADGLHSGVRRIVFGDDVPERFLGGYLSVVSVRNRLPAKVRWTATSCPTGCRWSTRPTTSTPRASKASCARHSPVCPCRSTDGSGRSSTLRRSTSTPSPSSS